MSEVKVNKISPRTNCGTVTLGDSGDTFTIPSGATITNAGTASGFGATGEISWDTTVKTTGTFTATSGVGYFCNTSGGTITANLPAGAAGSSVAFADYAETWQNNKVTVSPNGTDKIGGANSDVSLTTQGQSVTFVYIDGTQGWVNVLDSTSNVRGNEFIVGSVSGSCNTLTTSGNCKIAKFVNPGTFTVTCAAVSATNNVVSYMVVAGGGSGGADVGGGGGAGGFREYKSPVTPYTASPLDGNPGGTAITVSATAYPITVGGGGAVPVAPQPMGNNGNPSTFSTITSTAGGSGGGGPAPGTNKNGGPGGSGGGGGGWSRPAGCGGPTGPGCVGGPGSGNTPSTSPAQGSNGGTVSPGGPNWTGAGGGGATAVGQNGINQPTITTGTRCGGAGATTEITAAPVTYAVGGTGGNDQTSVPSTSTAADNSGSGGGGAGNWPSPNRGNAGGSGIVVIRYKFQ